MKNNKVLFIILYFLLVIGKNSFAKDIQIGTSQSGYKYYKNDSSIKNNAVSYNFGIFRLTDQNNKVLLAISSSCGSGAYVRITRYYKPSKMSDSNNSIASVSVSTNYDPRTMSNVSLGSALVDRIKERKSDMHEFKLSNNSSPDLNKFCSSGGTAIQPSANEAENWLKVIDAISITDSMETNSRAKESAFTNVSPSIDVKNAVLTPPIKDGYKTEYALVHRKDGKKYQEQQFLGIVQVCAPDYANITIDRTLSGDQEYKRDFFATGVEVITFSKKDDTKSQLDVVGSQERVGMSRITVDKKFNEAPRVDDFCQGTTPIILTREQAIDWHSRIGRIIGKYGIKP